MIVKQTHLENSFTVATEEIADSECITNEELGYFKKRFNELLELLAKENDIESNEEEE